MCNRANLVRLECSQDLEGWREDTDKAIIASKEETIGSRAYAADFIVLEEGLALVIGRFDLADFEEIERFPL